MMSGISVWKFVPIGMNVVWSLRYEVGCAGRVRLCFNEDEGFKFYG